MYYFSNNFLDGLKTKSENFQNKFYEMVDNVCKYIKTEEEKKEIQKNIEANYSLDIFYANKIHWDSNTVTKKIEVELHDFLLEFYKYLNSDEVMKSEPLIFACLSAPDEYLLSDETAPALEEIVITETLISFERIAQGCSPVEFSIICNDNLEGRGISCYVVCLK